MKKDQATSVPGPDTRVEQAETRTTRANTRTDEANTRTDDANARTDEANARTDDANTRTEEAEARNVEAIHAEITERKLTEEAVAQLAAIVDSSNDAIIGKDLNSIVTSWNLGAERMFGYSASEMIGRSITRLIPSDRQQEEMRIIDRVRSGERVEPFETVRVARDGRLVDVSVTVSPIKDKTGKVVGASKVARDITERKRAEEELLLYSQRRLSMALEAAQIGDWDLDLLTQTARRSLRHDQIFGYPELLPEWNYPLFLNHIHPEDRAGVDQTFQESVEAGRDWYIECRIIRADQKVRWIWARGMVFKDKSGRSTHMLGMVGDITERKQNEEELKRRSAELEAVNKELEAFSYSVSHDLRAPLRAVDGFSQAVLEDYGPQLPEEGRRYLQTIRNGAQRMGVLIDDLLTFSRLGRAPLKKREVNTGKLVRRSLEDLNAQREGRQVEIQIGDLPACRGDPALLNQVWVNLLSNALKYTRQRETAVIEIGCKLEEDENVYFVRDNGAGFDMRYADKLFGVFQRLHRADEFEGTGVGLAIVQRIIHRHGGRIWADAALDRGATFYFTLKERTSV